MLRVVVYNWTNWFGPVFTDFSIFLLVLLSVELMFPKRTWVWIYLMIILTVRAIEWMRTQFAFICFKVKRICLWVSFAIPAELMMVFGFVGPVVLNVFGLLDSTWECGMTPFLAIFTLQNLRVHVSTSNSCNEPTNIEALVNKSLGFTVILDILYIDSNDRHVWFRRHFDDVWFGHKSNIIENLILLDDSFDIVQGKAILNIAMREERNAYNLEIRLWLW